MLVRIRVTYLTITKALLALTDKRNLKSPIQINSKYVNAEALRQPWLLSCSSAPKPAVDVCFANRVRYDFQGKINILMKFPNGSIVFRNATTRKFFANSWYYDFTKWLSIRAHVNSKFNTVRPKMAEDFSTGRSLIYRYITMTDLVRSCAYRVLWWRSMLAQLCSFIEFSFYIHKYLGPDKPYLLSFIHFPQVSNWYLISCGNATGEKKYPYLIFSENLFFGIFTWMKQINVIYHSLYHFPNF